MSACSLMAAGGVSAIIDDSDMVEAIISYNQIQTRSELRDEMKGIMRLKDTNRTYHASMCGITDRSTTSRDDASFFTILHDRRMNSHFNSIVCSSAMCRICIPNMCGDCRSDNIRYMQMRTIILGFAGHDFTRTCIAVQGRPERSRFLEAAKSPGAALRPHSPLPWGLTRMPVPCSCPLPR